MIRAFKKSRKIMYAVGIPLSFTAVTAAWFILQNYTETSVMRALVSLLSGIVFFSIAVMVCRVIAMSEYQDLLIPFYKELDPGRMLSNLEAVDLKKLSEGERIMLSIHKANGYLYLGDTEKALSLLDYDSLKEKDLNNRYLVLGTLSSIYLMKYDEDKVNELLCSLKSIAASAKCPRDLSMRVRRVISYVELCSAIRKRKKCDTAPLEKDFASSRVPVHKLDAAYYLALYLSTHKRAQEASEYIEYINGEGGKTIYPSLLEKINE